jgi:hypothetical protein
MLTQGGRREWGRWSEAPAPRLPGLLFDAPLQGSQDEATASCRCSSRSIAGQAA